MLQISSKVYFFLSAFWAALVALPSTTLTVVALMTPTATVCLMSRTANLRREIESEGTTIKEGMRTHLPRGGKSVKGSTHMGLLGVSLTIAASPDLMNLGLSSTDLPVRRSTFSLISAN